MRQMPVPRIVSLLPSATEIICALGLSEQLVGRSHECDFPPEVKRLPACTEPKIDPKSVSAEIDRQVKSLIQDALSIYRIDTAKLRELRPDVIITQAQCEVCAVSLADVELEVSDWMDSKPRVLSLSPQRLVDVWSDIRSVAEVLGVTECGRDLLRQLKNRVVDIIEKSVPLKQRPTVACLEWLDPLMAAGNWVPELVELAGGRNLFGIAGAHSPWLNWESLVEADPEIIILMPCGFDLARIRKELPAVIGNPDWTKLRAVKSRDVYLADGSQFFNRPGPRLVESLEILAEIIHPTRFRFGHVDRAWAKLM